MEPTSFITLDTLKTMAGQVLAVVMFTQMVKSTWPTLSTYDLRAIAVMVGIALHGALQWHAGLPLSGYALTLMNGIGVALAAMKAAELIKGEAKP